MSSLSSVVSNLVRAQMGSSVAPTVTDDDLDRHVAELILKEAKQKAQRYRQDGIRAYLARNNDSNAPKPNKRFLSSIIRSTDDHNKSILRAQALAAQEARMEREEQERQERRARAEEAVEAERAQVEVCTPSTNPQSHSLRLSFSIPRTQSPVFTQEAFSVALPIPKPFCTTPRTGAPSLSAQSQVIPPSFSLQTRLVVIPHPPFLSHPIPLPLSLTSSLTFPMDKYFESSYDPRLDVAPLTMPTIPATGLISDAEFAGWDAMLEVIRLRRQDKEDKKAMERWGISKDADKGKSSTKEGEVSALDIKYKKRGSVREWDLGKEGF
ncbi:hypothetical protein C8Q76DRAFT_795486 [Earliella scabrosa]|nr:hypothetical protein C8Q76DRAFT_795486 [Earliella scabrosa]